MTPSGPRPTLIYDGDCGICRYWVEYWERLTRGQVDYRAYQDAAQDYPSIPLGDFRRAIQLIEPDGERYAGSGCDVSGSCAMHPDDARGGGSTLMCRVSGAGRQNGRTTLSLAAAIY